MTTPRTNVGAEAIKDHSTGGVPEAELAAALLQLVLCDLEDPQRLRSGDPLEILWEARKFCFSSDPEWRRSRLDWCDLAGVDPDFFQKQAIARARRA